MSITRKIIRWPNKFKPRTWKYFKKMRPLTSYVIIREEKNSEIILTFTENEEQCPPRLTL